MKSKGFYMMSPVLGLAFFLITVSVALYAATENNAAITAAYSMAGLKSTFVLSSVSSDFTNSYTQSYLQCVANRTQISQTTNIVDEIEGGLIDSLDSLTKLYDKAYKEVTIRTISKTHDDLIKAVVNEDDESNSVIHLTTEDELGYKSLNIQVYYNCRINGTESGTDARIAASFGGRTYVLDATEYCDELCISGDPVCCKGLKQPSNCVRAPKCSMCPECPASRIQGGDDDGDDDDDDEEPPEEECLPVEWSYDKDDCWMDEGRTKSCAYCLDSREECNALELPDPNIYDPALPYYTCMDITKVPHCHYLCYECDVYKGCKRSVGMVVAQYHEDGGGINPDDRCPPDGTDVQCPQCSDGECIGGECVECIEENIDTGDCIAYSDNKNDCNHAFCLDCENCRTDNVDCEVFEGFSKTICEALDPCPEKCELCPVCRGCTKEIEDIIGQAMQS